MPASIREQRDSILPKIGVAFGAGGIKGAAHVGILKVLEEYQIPIHMVAGSSIGAAIASLYACGYSANNIKELFASVSLDELMKVRPSKMGFMPCHDYEELIRVCTKDANIEDLPMPLRIIAVDLVSWQKIIFSKGNIAKAVRASSAVPGVITPVKYDDMLLADGYLLDNCPGDVLRDLGADVVIGINLLYQGHNEPKNMIETISRSMEIMAYANQKIDADIILNPITKPTTFLNKRMVRECSIMGEKCARKNIDKIITIIKARTVELNKG
ncbi:MAG: patatin-like phospholipase family protein [Bacillota bacterium]|jgi:NTE family protein